MSTDVFKGYDYISTEFYRHLDLGSLLVVGIKIIDWLYQNWSIKFFNIVLLCGSKLVFFRTKIHYDNFQEYNHICINFFPINIIKPYNSIKPKLLFEYIKSDGENPLIYYVVVILGFDNKLIFSHEILLWCF